MRSALPPGLADRSLADALIGLATTCPVPCRIDARDAERCAASVEATAYVVLAEALTNVARHSNAQQAHVTLRRRTEAHDGTFTLTSPPGGPTTVEVSLPCGS